MEGSGSGLRLEGLRKVNKTVFGKSLPLPKSGTVGTSAEIWNSCYYGQSSEQSVPPSRMGTVGTPTEFGNSRYPYRNW